MQPQRPDRALHGYIYYRWTAGYMRVVRYFLERGRRLGALRRAAGNRLQLTHHAKVVPTSDARRVLTIERPVEWRDLESVVPFSVARDVVLEAPPRIALTECACRAVAEKAKERDSSCGPLETCLYLGDPIASFVVEHQPGKARFVTVDEALAVIEAAAGRHDLHTLWFKDAAAGRMYAICNCCRCCCIGLKAEREGFHPLASSGYVAAVDESRCTDCGRCVEACPFGALSRSELSGTRDGGCASVDAGLCLGCGTCLALCTSEAIGLRPAESGPRPLPLAPPLSARSAGCR